MNEFIDNDPKMLELLEALTRNNASSSSDGALDAVSFRLAAVRKLFNQAVAASERKQTRDPFNLEKPLILVDLDVHRVVDEEDL